MTEGHNADAKWSEVQLEGEDSERTVNCLRGRLLAERTASRKARDEAEQLGNKVMELENLLKEETKSRDRAEKKLKSVMKKFASINISYFLDKTDISSASSSVASSSTKELEKSQAPKENDKSPRGSADLFPSPSQQFLLKGVQESSTTEESSGSVFAANFKMPSTDAEVTEQTVPQKATVENSLTSASNSEKSSYLAIDQHCNDSAADNELSGDQDPKDHVDNSMALVTVDVPQESHTHTIDPKVLDGTVMEVLETLRQAKEQLLSSMERRQTNMIKVG